MRIMLYSKYLFLYILSFIFLKPTTVNGLIDPITGAFAIGAFITGYYVNQSYFGFPFYSSCPKEIRLLGKIYYIIIIVIMLNLFLIIKTK